MEFASPPRKLLLQEKKSPMEFASLSKKTSPPRKEITYGIILLELKSR
jgi:hypothetical protein